MPTITVDQGTASHFAAQAFQQTHPRFFICAKNGRLMMERMMERNRDLANSEHYHITFEELESEGAFFYPNRETLAKCTAAEAELMGKENGIPRFDSNGRIRAMTGVPSGNQRLPLTFAHNIVNLDVSPPSER